MKITCTHPEADFDGVLPVKHINARCTPNLIEKGGQQQ